MENFCDVILMTYFRWLWSFIVS